LNPSDERTSAFRHSERLNEQRKLKDRVPCERAVRINRACPETIDAGSPKRQANVEPPTKLAMVRRSDIKAKKEDKGADKAELTEQKRMLSSNNQQKREATNQKDETRKGRRLRLETLNSSNERTSAFRNLERLNEKKKPNDKVP
jgi:hypothetical protein